MSCVIHIVLGAGVSRTTRFPMISSLFLPPAELGVPACAWSLSAVWLFLLWPGCDQAGSVLILQAMRCTLKTILMFSGTPLVGLELVYTFQKTADFQFGVIFNV